MELENIDKEKIFETEQGRQIIGRILDEYFENIKKPDEVDLKHLTSFQQERENEFYEKASKIVEDYKKLFDTMDLSFVKPDHEIYLKIFVSTKFREDLNDFSHRIDDRINQLITRLTQLKALNGNI